MSGVKGEVKHRGLIVILCVLGVAIVGLVVGNVVVMMNRGKEDAAVSDDWQTLENPPFEEIVISEEKLKIEEDLVKYSEEFNEKIQSLLSEDVVDVAQANDLLNTAIAKALDSDSVDYAYMYINTYYDALTSRGLYREALDEMLSLNYDVYSEPTRYRLYDKVINLANEVGDGEALAKYQKLQESVAEAYWTDYRRTEDAVKNFKDEQLQMIKERTGGDN